MSRGKLAAATLALVLVSLAAASSVGAAGGRDLLAGSADQTLFAGTDAQEHDHYAVGATSNADGTDPQGSITYSSDSPGLPQSNFHGDVSQGCLIVQGNTAIAVGMLPQSEQFIVQTNGGPRLIEWVGVWVQDNGNPDQGQPTDQSVAALLFDTSGQHICAAGLTNTLFPFDHGNFVVKDAS